MEARIAAVAVEVTVVTAVEVGATVIVAMVAVEVITTITTVALTEEVLTFQVPVAPSSKLYPNPQYILLQL